jgi:CRP/FNR family transcriptional regulator, nitrogen oxide reductase regulator
MATVDPSLVAHLPLFAGFSADELGEILREARSARFAKNNAVLQQGEEAHSFYVLLHGHVRASKTTPTGEQVVVRYVASGETFGVAMAIGLQRYPATATAVDDSVVLAWPSASWPRLVEKFPALATNTLQTVGSRLQETHTRVVEMSTQQVEQRVAHALLRRAADASHPEGEEHADGLRGGAHHIVNQIVKSNGHAHLRSPVNDNATRLPHSLSRRNLHRIYRPER